jgi:hypothetical protein
MAGEVTVGMKYAVGGRVVACCVHGVGAGFVEGCLKEISKTFGLRGEHGTVLTGNRTSLVVMLVIVTILPVL